VGRHIENIVDILMYRYRFGTLDIGFFRYIHIISVTSEILVIFRYFIIFVRLFNVNLKTENYVSKIEYLAYLAT